MEWNGTELGNGPPRSVSGRNLSDIPPRGGAPRENQRLQEAILANSNQDMIATIDLGSNSFRLEICRNDNGQLQQVDSIKEMVRFAGGLNEDKILSKESQARALDCLGRFGERIRGFKKSQVRVVATNTFRVAKNIGPFIEKAQKVLGFPIEVIAGREEARLIYTGVVHSVDFDGRKALIVDIGGGSTEFIIGKEITPILTESLALGCVSYSMRFFHDGKITKENFNNAVNTARFQIQSIAKDYLSEGWELAIGTSGTAKAIREIISNQFGDTEKIDMPNMEKIAQRLLDAGSVKKAKLDGLKPDRVESFAGGFAVMYAIFKELEVSEMLVSDVGLRQGVFYDLVGRKLDKDLRFDTVDHFQKIYNVDREQAARVENIALKCFNGLLMQMKEQQWNNQRKFLLWACRLHEIGLGISHLGYHKHSSYIVREADMPGFSKIEQSRLARLILAHRGDLGKMVPMVESEQVWGVILCLRLAVIFCRARTDVVFPENTTLEINLKKKKYVLKIPKAWLAGNPLTFDALRQEAEQWNAIGHHFKIQEA